MSTTTVRIDTYAYSLQPAVNFVSSPLMRMQGSGGTAYGYETITPPVVGTDVLYTSAILEWHARGSWGACTLTARRCTAPRGYSSLNYTNQPASTATGAVATSLGALASGALIQQDITAFVQSWATGATPNYGLRFDVGATAAKYIHSAQSTTTAYRPRLVYTAYRKPSVPQVTAPTANKQVSIARPKLTWTASTDPLMLQASYQVQMNASDVWTSPTYDSAEVASTAGEHLVTFDISAAATWYWRVRVKNGGGQWSDWTAGQQFGRTNKPTFSITQPTGGTWTDSTPPVTWSALSAGTQKQFQVQHLVGGVVKIDSLIIAGTDTSWTSEQAIPGFMGGSVTTRVRLWDTVDRAATPGDDPAVVVDSVWTYTPGATAPATSLAVAEHSTMPVPVLTWQRSSSPDRWDVQRSIDGGDYESILIAEGPDLSAGGTSYTYTDLTCPPHHDVSYKVVAGVNGVDASASPTASITIDSSFIWLLDPEDNTFWCALAEQNDTSLAYSEDSEAVYVKGADRAQVTFDALHGFDGEVSGGVYGTASSPLLGRTAQQMRDAIVLHVKTYQTRIFRLIIADYNLPVVVRSLTPTLRPQAELSYGISFTANQQGELPWS